MGRRRRRDQLCERLPIPRFVSLKSDRVNARSGAEQGSGSPLGLYPLGMPVEITAEFENWRRIRDWEGAEGWVYHSALLSGKRTAVVVPKIKDELVPLATRMRTLNPGCRRVCSLACWGPSNPAMARGASSAAKSFEGYIRQELIVGRLSETRRWSRRTRRLYLRPAARRSWRF